MLQVLPHKSEVNRYVTILYLLGRYSGLHCLVSVKCLFLCFLPCTQRKWKSLGFCFIHHVPAAIVLAITLAVYRTWGWGNHSILKFDLSNISHLRGCCSFASDPRTRAKESGCLNNRGGTGCRKFSVFSSFFIVLHTFLCIIILLFAMDR